MINGIIPELEEQRRDALVGYYLGQLVPSNATSAPLGLTTPDDLYEYLLIDNQVSGEVETSRVAQGIASIQQYINAIYYGMEPGYTQGFDDDHLQLWREGMSEYSVWAGYQMIEDYPENYIDPTLRLGKTSQFQAFESELGQSRLNEDSVRAALKNYLDSFEVVSNLQVMSCYIDGEDFLQADYYFVGRQSVEPFGYYWRRAKINLQKDSSQVLPSAWTEWKKIDVAFDAQVQHARLVVVDGRLHFIWVELGQPEVDDSGVKTGKYYYRAKMTYKQLSDKWSPATQIYEGLTDKQSLNEVRNGSVLAGRFTLVASMDIRFAGEPRLIVCFQYRTDMSSAEVVDEPERFVRVFDKTFNRIRVSESDEAQLYAIAVTMLGGNPDRAQFPLGGKYTGGNIEWQLDRVHWNQSGDNDIPNGGINQSLELGVKLLSSGAGCSLEVQGVCTAKRNRRGTFSVSLFGKRGVDGILYNFELRGTQSKFYLDIAVTASNNNLLPGDLKGSLNWNGKLIKGYVAEDFHVVEFHDDGCVVLQANLELPIDPETFPTPTFDEVYEGCGFVVDMQGGPLALATYTNHYSETLVPVTQGFDIWESAPAVSSQLVLNGAARTPVESVPWTGMEAVKAIRFGALPKGSGYGYNEYQITRVVKPTPVPLIVSTDAGGQFLDLAALELPSLRYVRMNTTFARELVKRAELSLKNALSWEAQHTPEPPEPGGAATSLDFKGANGRYFWELFFHVPHLAAHRLHTEFDYLGAESWLHYLFNPLERIAPLYPPPAAGHPYWSSRPLTFDNDPAYEPGGLGDPDAIAYGAPSHYRKAIFVFYLNNLIAHGDMLYRQLTRDTLNQAQLLYVRAASLLGPLSKGRSISRWTPMTLQEAAAHDETLFADFEASGLDGLERDIPSHFDGQLWLHLLDAPWFRLPVNNKLLDLWERLALRLYNLRHNLSLDGKPLSLPLYAPAANPADLLRAQAAGGGSGQRRLGSLAIIPPYRFRAMLPRVQNAVETLIRYGDQLRGYMELRDRADQEELQQSHILELSAFSETLQAQMIEQAIKSREALVGSRVAIESRKAYYRKLEQEDVSQAESRALDLHNQAKFMEMAALGVTVAGHALDGAVPTIFGLANGGIRPGSFGFAAASAIQIASLGKSRDADLALMSEQYRRRRIEWQFLARQAEEDLQAIDQQIEVQDIAIEAARTSLAQATKAQEQAQIYYTFLKSRATSPALYQWLMGQMATLYFQAYDVVLSMCLSTEACWQYEIGDRDTRFVPVNAWADNRYGLTAGEMLKLGLLQMESAFISRHERRLELSKTVSLKNLLKNYDPGASAQAAELRATGWEAVIAELQTAGQIAFDLKSSLFDKDYPGQYLRQLVRVSVSIPAVLGPYEDICVLLTQQSSNVLLSPDIGGVRYLYKEAGELPQDEGEVDPTHIVFNPRANQQIGISSGVDDHGMFMLDFGDERYFPFEGTGAVSRWTLSFPRHESERQKAILGSLTDIILHVRYLAVDGGKVFNAEVEKLVKTVEEGESSRLLR
ncbi:Tc toxin subunit A-related protein [Pseudomonas capsici]|uniref:Tc toxin subunit A-related protein n=1 Tax=Pseudomonas capsici TaxID=2810614 RepID=UPI0021F134C9|nr:neuraminidase-like domain-containing protein [Pseudomonas capsici]MCV4264265.1 neuraminidase-like domain-containing protein [Pseudomonas capsici]